MSGNNFMNWDNLGCFVDNDEMMMDMDEEANEFIKNPSYSNAFYPQMETISIRELVQCGVSKFKISLRNCIDWKMDSENCSNLFDGFSIASMSSPNLFSSSDSFNRFVQNKDLLAPFNVKIPECTHSLEMKPLTEMDKTRDSTIADIEALVIKILQDIKTERNVKMLIPNSTRWEDLEMENGVLSIKKRPLIMHRTLSFTYLNCRHHLAIILYVLSEVYHLLITNTTCLERELYYDNPDLSENQLNIKSAINDICRALKVSPWDLGIRSSSKGLITGAIRIHMPEHVIIDCSMYDGASLIPDVQRIRLIETTAKFVLIVEKDTIFAKLLKENILLDINSDIILITGRGYPDLSTRLLIKRLWNDLRLPIYALVDADPFGIEIMLVYRFGSRAMALNSDQLACPEIRWIGIHPSEIDILAIPTVPQSKRDNKKVIELLQRSYINDEIRTELEVLQKLNCKAEIESVARFSINFLVTDYIPNKIKRNLVL